MSLSRSTAFTSLLVLTALVSVNCSSDPESNGTAGATSQAGTNATSGTGGGGSSTGGAPTAGTSAGMATGGGGKGGTASGGTSPSGGGGASATAGTSGSSTGGSGGSSAGSGGNIGSGGNSGGSGGASGSGGGGSGTFTLTSSKLTEGAMFATEYTCASGNAGKSVPLTWTAGPSGTMSYAVVLLDTNTNPPFNHWVIWDIPSTVTMLPEGLATDAMLTMPAGAKQKGGQGSGYLGPCPSGMSHTYKFTVYAMDAATLAGAMTSMSTADLSAAVQMHDLASASLSGVSNATKP